VHVNNVDGTQMAAKIEGTFEIDANSFEFLAIAFGRIGGQNIGVKLSEETENKLKACEVMEFLGISTLADVDMGELSFGQKKLLDLGAVLMADPDLILLDEPAAGVNLRLLEDIINKLITLKNQGKTILLIEHNMDLVMEISDEVIVMSAGMVIASGQPTEIQKNTEVLEAYLGNNA